MFWNIVRRLDTNGEMDNGCQAVLKTVAGKTVAGSTPVLSARINLDKELHMITDFKNIPLEIDNEIDWNIAPEEAIAMFLEWGQLRGQKYYVNSNDYSIFFVVNTWHEPVIFLRKVSTESIDILGTFKFPSKFIEGIYRHKGTYKVSEELQDWIKKEMKST